MSHTARRAGEDVVSSDLTVGADVGGRVRRARALLAAGAAAGPIYIALGAAQAVLREGFDPRRHALSHLANGEYGWVQIASFIAVGCLLIAAAAGLRVVGRNARGGRSVWAPLLLAAYGVGLIGAGIFVADPAPGFPPGASPPPTMTRAGLMHFVSGAVGFYALVAFCFVVARRFGAVRERGWMWLSVATGVGFLASFAAVASGSTSPTVLLAFYAAVAWSWIWLSMVLWRARRG